MKRILTIQDLSCLGKCSLTVALPIVSAMGIEAAILPTSLLSNHTAFEEFTFLDLTGELEKIHSSWVNQDFTFDGIYTGYLGSASLIEISKKFIETFGKGEGKLTLVDPAMGDYGKLYTGFDKNYAKAMAAFCSEADVIVPNSTEAAFMLGEEWKQEYTKEQTQELLKKLCDLGPSISVLTGVSLSENRLGVMSYDRNKDEFFTYDSEKLPRMFHGTGDIFASSLYGALILGKTIEDALKIAVDYTWESIKITIDTPNHIWYGVHFEEAIPKLLSLTYGA